MLSRVVAIAVFGCGRLEFAPPPVADSAPGDTEPDAPDCAITSGLVGQWSLDATEINGSLVVDGSGNGRHGTIVGTPPGLVPGRVGEALDFPTTATYIEMPGLPLDTSDGGINSFSMWFFNDDPDVDDALFYVPEGPMAAPPRYDVWLNFNRIQEVTLCINGGVSDCWGVSDPSLLGRWVHVVALLVNGRTDGGRIFLDGVEANLSCRFGVCTEVRSAMSPFRISGSDSNYPWTGLVDDVRIFNRALSQSEIETLHACAP